MLFRQHKYEVLPCDFSDELHRQACVSLIQEYMRDPMGGELEPDADHAMRLLHGLTSHPSAHVLLMKEEHTFIGLMTYFINFSTFKAKPYINVHDIFVRKDSRRKGLGRAFLEYLLTLADQQGFSKITLEVREDNVAAQKLYKSLGFEDTKPPMWFWTKTL